MNETGSWEVPELEPNARNFDEDTRFHRPSHLKRKHGTKYIVPPKAEYLQQLVDEEKQHQTLKMRSSTAVKNGDDWISLMTKPQVRQSAIRSSTGRLVSYDQTGGS